MATATDLQVQNFVDQHIRPFCENAAALKIQADAIKASFDDIYTALTEQNPTWTDSRTDGPPHLLTPADVLAINAWWTAFQSAINTLSSDANVQGMQQNYATLRKACVRF